MTPLVVSFLAAVAVTLLLFGFLYWQSNDRVDDLQADDAADQAVITELADGLDATREQLLDRNIVPVVPDPEITIREIVGERGEQGEPGADATDKQVEAAVATYLLFHPPTPGTDGTDGTNGVDGQDGETPVCYFEENQCQGAPGTNGTNGADSTIPGPTGPQGPPGPPTQCEAGHHWETVQIQGQDYRACAAD